MSENQTLADLRLLLDYGFLTDKCIVKTPGGEFRFELKTITPLEEADAQQAVVVRVGASDETAKNIHTAIELLARCITKVNGVALEEYPNAKGDTALQKKRYVVSKFSEKLMLPLWKSYQDLKARTSEGEGDTEDLKK